MDVSLQYLAKKRYCFVFGAWGFVLKIYKHVRRFAARAVLLNGQRYRIATAKVQRLIGKCRSYT